MKTIVVKTETEVIKKLREFIKLSAEAAIQKNGAFRIGLSGGSVVNYLSSAIQEIQSDFSKWKLFFCDERYVPTSDADSTFGVYKTALIPKSALKEEQFIQIDVALSLEDCAKDYEEKILKEFNAVSGVVPQFDLLLLGMGPDGHTCSLFPGHDLLKEEQRLIAPISDSPKPPPKRVTMTFPLINKSSRCIFAMCGEGKADMVKRVFVDKETLPAGMVKPENGELICIFDEAAGKFIN